MRYLLFLVFLIPGLQGEKYDISLNLEVGQTYCHTIRTESDFLMMVNDMEMPISTIFEARLIYEVLEDQDTIYKLNVQYEKLSMVNKSPMATFELSSDTAASTNKMSGFLRELVNKPFTISLDKNGKITDTQNADTLYSSLWNGKAAEMISSNAMMTEQLKKQLGVAMILENYEMLSAMYPGRQLAVGESWSNSTKLGNRLGGITGNTFTLSAVSDRRLSIEGKSETYTNDNNASVELMGKRMEYELDGGIVFNCMMDYRTGWIQEATIKQDFKGEIKMLADEAWNNKSIPVAISSVTTITE